MSKILKKIILFCIIVLTDSSQSFSMNILVTGTRQLFDKETIKIAAIGFLTVAGFSTINSGVINHIVANSDDYAHDLDFSPEVSEILSFKNDILQATSIGIMTALASRIGPKAWPQINLADLILPTCALATGIGITSYCVNFYHKKNNEHQVDALALTKITSNSCMNAIEILLPLSIVWYRYIHSQQPL